MVMYDIFWYMWAGDSRTVLYALLVQLVHYKLRWLWQGGQDIISMLGQIMKPKKTEITGDFVQHSLWLDIVAVVARDWTWAQDSGL